MIETILSIETHATTGAGEQVMRVKKVLDHVGIQVIRSQTSAAEDDKGTKKH